MTESPPDRGVKAYIKNVPWARRTFLSLRMMKSRIKHGFRKIPFVFSGGRRFGSVYQSDLLVNAIGPRQKRGDISDHVGTLFFHAVDSQCRLIVELGTRGGASTRALLAAADENSSAMLSIDLDDCTAIDMHDRSRWNFVQADDVAFGKDGFVAWCETQQLEPEIDLLFIDTSHEYHHTKQEIEIWSRFLSSTGSMIFHDTNMGHGIYARTDGSVDAAWNNDRGVIRAIEEFVGREYDETSYFTDLTPDFNIIHYPNCCGLTILKRRPTE